MMQLMDKGERTNISDFGRGRHQSCPHLFMKHYGTTSSHTLWDYKGQSHATQISVHVEWHSKEDIQN